mmetsp:Transcript_63126/g.185169  ORF Transcript_63126/g.185169 Transcript_63126/m.185169 type:complete len:211 (+) Transcript_63126:1103-1735(+)
MQREHHDAQALADAEEGEGEAERRVPAVEELDHADQAEHADEAQDPHHADTMGCAMYVVGVRVPAAEEVRYHVPRHHGHQVGPEPAGLQVVGQGERHVVLRNLDGRALVGVLRQGIRDRVCHVEREHDVQGEQQVDRVIHLYQHRRSVVHQCHLVGEHPGRDKQGHDHDDVPAIHEDALLWHDGELAALPSLAEGGLLQDDAVALVYYRP